MVKSYDDYDYDDEYEEGRDWPVLFGAGGALLLLVAAVVWFGVLPRGGDDDSEQVATANPGSQPEATVTAADAPTTDPAESVDRTDENTVSVDADEPTGTTSTTTDRSAPASDTLDSVPAVSTTAAQLPTASYQTLPDGSPVPVLAMYDGELITLSGAVPSEAAAERLRVLALANSSVPGAEVASFLTVDPAVPVGVGVRVIEMNSARFPEGSPTISIEHAAQLNRIVAVMNALPNITVDVIGHSDQRGDDQANFELSTERARAAADYLTSQGIDPTRLSSRGAGESDLLTLNNDEAALALNRRTEFVLFGLLLDVPEPA